MGDCKLEISERIKLEFGLSLFQVRWAHFLPLLEMLFLVSMNLSWLMEKRGFDDGDRWFSLKILIKDNLANPVRSSAALERKSLLEKYHICDISLGKVWCKDFLARSKTGGWEVYIYEYWSHSIDFQEDDEGCIWMVNHWLLQRVGVHEDDERWIFTIVFFISSDSSLVTWSTGSLVIESNWLRLLSSPGFVCLW